MSRLWGLKFCVVIGVRWTSPAQTDLLLIQIAVQVSRTHRCLLCAGSQHTAVEILKPFCPPSLYQLRVN